MIEELDIEPVYIHRKRKCNYTFSFALISVLLNIVILSLLIAGASVASDLKGTIDDAQQAVHGLKGISSDMNFIKRKLISYDSSISEIITLLRKISSYGDDIDNITKFLSNPLSIFGGGSDNNTLKVL